MYSKNELECLFNCGDQARLLAAINVLEKELKDKIGQIILYSASLPCLTFHIDEGDNFKELKDCVNNIRYLCAEFNNIDVQFNGVLARIDNYLKKFENDH